MNKILVISGHPDMGRSRANKAILEKFQTLVPEAEIVRLDALYPDFKIDSETEQNRLLRADTVVFEFPFESYSAPSLMHRYFEEVLTFGFAFGVFPSKVSGKRLIFSFTVGGTEDVYSKNGPLGFTMSDFMPQFRALSNICQFEWIEPVISYGMILRNPSDETEVAAFNEKVSRHALLQKERVCGEKA